MSSAADASQVRQVRRRSDDASPPRQVRPRIRLPQVDRATRKLVVEAEFMQIWLDGLNFETFSEVLLHALDAVFDGTRA